MTHKEDRLGLKDDLKEFTLKVFYAGAKAYSDLLIETMDEHKMQYWPRRLFLQLNEEFQKKSKVPREFVFDP